MDTLAVYLVIRCGTNVNVCRTFSLHFTCRHYNVYGITDTITWWSSIARRAAIAKAKQRWSVGWVTKYKLQDIVLYRSINIDSPTNSHRARVMGYGPFSLCVIHIEGLCLSSIRLMMMMMMNIY
jgi:hypothetical protein